MQTNQRLLFFAVFCAVWLIGACAAPADFRLQDYLGRDWRQETVTFPLTQEQLRHAKAGHALFDADGRAVTYQLVEGATARETRLAFQSDLPAYATRSFTFTNQRAATTSDLTVKETPENIVLANDNTGIIIARKLKDGSGPILGVRLPSGAWVTGSRLTVNQPVDEYTTTVVARGPVFAEVTCRAAIGAGAWELRLRVFAHEPVVLVDETSSLDGPTATFSLDLKENFNPDTLLYRCGMMKEGASYGKNLTWKLADGDVYQFEPWLRWHQGDRRGNYFGLYREDGNDLLALAAREAGAWIDPAIPAAKRVPPTRTVTRDVQGIHLDFPLKMGQRKWMYIALPTEPCLAETKDENISYKSPLPYRYLVKYGHFPLDMVKDYVLEWDAEKDSHPRLLTTPKDVVHFRASIKDLRPYEAAIAQSLRTTPDEFGLEQSITTYLATQNPELGRHLVDGALHLTQRSIEVFFDQEGLPFGAAPHGPSRISMPALLLTDIALGTDQGTPEMRRRLLAQAAFIGYTLNRPEYWSPERGYSANPNMTTMAACYQTAAGALLPSHPRAGEWLQHGLSELKHELDNWSDDNGGWLEAPHYAMVSYDLILSGMVMAFNGAGDETLFSPRMRRIIEWFGKITTPPDTRLGGFRHLPPIGNTYCNEPSGEFGVIAYLWKDRDPAFSAQMQWLYQQHRSLKYPGVGGPYPGMDGFRALMLDPDLPVNAPVYGSSLFPKTGAILRNVFPADRETTLYMIAGTNHDHYDLDSGSVTIWGKGRIVADDFGYNGRAPLVDHNSIDSSLNAYIMEVKEFTPAARLDYLRGVSGGWTRQVAFVKDLDPLAANYFVIADTLAKPVAATWRLWCTAQEIKLSPRQALVVGPEDVDTDVVFLQPDEVKLSTEEKVCGGYKVDVDGQFKAHKPAQNGVIAKLAQGTGVITVIYPRLKTEKPPVVTALAGGKVAKVQHAQGTDYVFMSDVPFTFTDGDISFTGTVGAVQRRGGKPQLDLGAPGRLVVGDEVVTKE